MLCIYVNGDGGCQFKVTSVLPGNFLGGYQPVIALNNKLLLPAATTDHIQLVGVVLVMQRYYF